MFANKYYMCLRLEVDSMNILIILYRKSHIRYVQDANTDSQIPLLHETLNRGAFSSFPATKTHHLENRRMTIAFSSSAGLIQPQRNDMRVQ